MEIAEDIQCSGCGQTIPNSCTNFTCPHCGYEYEWDPFGIICEGHPTTGRKIAPSVIPSPPIAKKATRKKVTAIDPDLATDMDDLVAKIIHAVLDDFELVYHGGDPHVNPTPTTPKAVKSVLEKNAKIFK